MSEERLNGSTPPLTREENLTWYLHVIPYDQSVTVPDLGMVTPWIGVLARKDEREPLAVDAYPEEPSEEMICAFVEDGIMIGGTLPGAIEVFEKRSAESLAPLATKYEIDVLLHTVTPDDLRSITTEFIEQIDPEELVLALTELSPEQEDALDLMRMVGEESLPSDETWLIHFAEYPEEINIPALGSVTPTLGIVVDVDTGDAILAIVSSEPPLTDHLVAAIVGHMLQTKVIPSSIELTEPTFLQVLEALGEVYGFSAGMADSVTTDVAVLNEKVAQTDREEIMKRLEEYAGLG